MSDSLRPSELQHTRLPWLSLSPGVCSNSCPLSRWCHSTISPSVIPFSFCPQSFPRSGAFPMNWLFTSGGQNIEISALASVLPMNIKGWWIAYSGERWLSWRYSRSSWKGLYRKKLRLSGKSQHQLSGTWMSHQWAPMSWSAFSSLGQAFRWL